MIELCITLSPLPAQYKPVIRRVSSGTSNQTAAASRNYNYEDYYNSSSSTPPATSNAASLESSSGEPSPTSSISIQHCAVGHRCRCGSSSSSGNCYCLGLSTTDPSTQGTSNTSSPEWDVAVQLSNCNELRSHMSSSLLRELGSTVVVAAASDVACTKVNGPHLSL